MADEFMLRDERTIGDILATCPRWGIPHFQRGLVWDDGAVSLLLESLYHDTPIGSLVLWKCADPTQGISWVGDEPFDYLIIDGQQRIRSLHRAFAGLGAEDGVGGEEKGRRAWCVNLRATAELGRYFERKPREHPLFVNVLERDLDDRGVDGGPDASRRPPSKFSRNFVRLRWLLDGSIDDAKGRISAENGEVHDHLAGLNKVIDRLRSMRGRQVFVRIERDRSLAEIVDIYNRINSAGKRVEGEERAFATLAAIDPTTGQHVEKLFRLLHGAPQLQGIERDHALRRQKERSFGFKLFMRTFAQVCAYHFGSQSGMEAFSFDFFQSATFAAKARSADLRHLWEIAKKAICYIHSLLSEDLYCDDLRFLPETSSLVPVFQLLIRYPGLMEANLPAYPAFRRKVAALCLQLVMAEHPQNRIAQLVRMASDVRAKEAGETLRKMLEHDRGRGLNPQTLAERLGASNSLQDRYLLLLYWLERRRKARDFSYAENAKQLAKPAEFRPGAETVIDRAAEAERQHIAPYSELKKVYSDLREHAGRVGTHKANSIGNITYISRKLNSYEEGIGENALALEAESQDNLQAHFLAGVAPRMDTEASFETFCRERRDAIAHGFLDWLDKMRDEALMEVPAGNRINPTPAEYADYAQMADEIRRFQFDDEVEDLLVDISCACKRIPIRGKQNSAGLRMGKKGLLVITAHQDTRTIQVRPEADDLVEKLRADCPSVAWSRGKDTDPSALCRLTLKVLRDAVRRVPVAAEASAEDRRPEPTRGPY
jgi:hypothetical protein